MGCDIHSNAERKNESGQWEKIEGLHPFDASSTCDPGEGKAETFREFLGKWFFDDLEKLKEAGAERVVFWFDN